MNTASDSTATPPPSAPWRPGLGRRWFTPSGALVTELDRSVDAADIFVALSGAPHLLFLDSAARDSATRDSPGDGAAAEPAIRLGRFSYLAADPIHSLTVAAPNSTTASSPAGEVAVALTEVRRLLRDLACPTIPGLPPFQGGVAGLVSYECGLLLQGLSPGRLRPDALAPETPLLSLHVYDVVFAFDHDLGQGWIISQGQPAEGPTARRTRAEERLESLLGRLHTPQPRQAHPAARAPSAASAAPLPQSPASSAATPHPLPGHPGIFSTHSPQSYRKMVQAGIELVRAGDIFQVNLAQCLWLEAAIDPLELYARARALNPAPFAGYFQAGDVQIASMSPERFLSVSQGTVRMHPIKGTRRVLSQPEADLYAGNDLEESAKDRAENVMIVDLVRNDLSRTCTPQSVRVESLCRLERYRYVQHLVSIVSGRLQPGRQALDAVEAAFPGGSVTGAPKFRACEIIRDLEGVSRGAYCGSLGFLGFDGNADFNLLIRTFVVTSTGVRFSAGGGITAASDPVAEYAESLHKAEGMLRVLGSFGFGNSGSGAGGPAS
jgi:para-aminobenzoate synthetase component 1